MNILGVVADRDENDMYKIAVKAGILSTRYSRNQLDLCPQRLLRDTDVNTHCTTTLRQALKSTASVVSHGAVRSAASSYAAMHTVAGSRPVLVIVWEWHIGLALLCGCSGALEYPTTNSCGPINKSPPFFAVIAQKERNSVKPIGVSALKQRGFATAGATVVLHVEINEKILVCDHMLFYYEF